MSLSSQAASVTLSWDANTTVSGPSYKIYYGSASGVYTNAVWIGTGTNYTVDGLNSNGTYYFVVTTFNSAGQESGYSSEVAYTFVNGQPTLVPMSTPTVVQPGQVQFTPQGTSGLQYVVQASTD
ncbi:MAG TPA: fibronectin type III domain-containing protein, partial [Verrucomicrobiae bacterium]|nr:fibronectin type III domain-containing protein [Verrucomicrobiae bacterium]